MSSLPVADVFMIGGTIGLAFTAAAMTAWDAVSRLRRKLRRMDPRGRW